MLDLQTALKYLPGLVRVVSACGRGLELCDETQTILGFQDATVRQQSLQRN